MDNIWNNEQLEFIDKLSSVSSVFNNILERDPQGNVIDYESRTQIEELYKKIKVILNKLQKHEFTVAVVGLEKAGKSTLGNAIIGCYALPEYTERCTYTTTEIKAGTEDKGIISFYTRAEFNKNFNALLDAVKYPHNEIIEFDQISPSAFDNYWKTIEDKDPGLYMLHTGTTAQDIKAIIEHVNDIKECIDSAPKEFVGSDELSSPKFQAYITGIVGTDEFGAAKRKSYPYAVKKVEIASSLLGKMDMRHVVLYDVPGFDSPTELHKRQTEEMLKMADSIILVTNVGDRPNLTENQLSMIRKGRDEDVKLSDKTFVFGNKIDRAGNKKQAEGNKAALRKNVVSDFKIAQDERVFFGSAKSFLEDHSIVSPDEKLRGMVNAGNILKEWGMSDGVEELKESLKDYYANDRFVVLKKRAQGCIENAKKLMHDIVDNFEPSNLYEQNQQEANALMLSSQHGLQDFCDHAKSIANEVRAQVDTEKPFSLLIKNSIDEIFPLQSTGDQLYIDVKFAENTDTDNVIHLSDINANLRKRLHVKFIKKLVETTADATKQKQKEIRDKLVLQLLTDTGMNDDNPYKEELIESVNKLFEEILIKDGQSCQFNPLIERFSNGLIEALIDHPFNSSERIQKLQTALPEYRSLAAFYLNEDESKKELSDTEFCCWLISHMQLSEVNTEKTESSLREIFDSVQKATLSIASIAVDIFPVARWAKILVNGYVVLNGVNKELLKKKLSKCILNSSFSSKTRGEQDDAIEQCIINFTDDRAGTGTSLKLTDELSKYSDLNYGISIESEEDLINYLNDDIEILKDITLHSVINAVALERAFISVILKNIELLRNAAHGRNSRDTFDKWMVKYNTKVKYREFSVLKTKSMEDQARMNIAQSIKELLENIE